MAKHLLMLGAFCLLSVLVARAQTFQDATHLLQSQSDPVRPIVGGSAIDVNSDGLVDVFHLGRLYIQQRDGTFEDAMFASGIGDRIGRMQGGVWADLDGDGFLDLYTANLTERSLFYHNLGDGRFRALIDGPEAPSRTVSPLWADLDGDNQLDVFVTGETGRNYFFAEISTVEGVPGITAIERARESGLVFARDACGASASDYDRDGDVDIFVASCDTSSTAEGGDMLFRQDGRYSFTQLIGNQYLPLNYRYSRGSVWFDVNNDGWQDLFVMNHVRDPLVPFVDGHDVLYLNDRGTFRDATRELGVAGGAYEQGYSATSADFDNDGWLDLLVLNWPGIHFESSVADHLFKNVEGQSFVDVWDSSIQLALNNPLPEESIGVVADFNNDGWIDVFLISQYGNRLLLNEGGENAWLKVSLRGISSNYSGIGARVEIYRDGMVQMREIHAGEGYASQNHNLTAHFGLGRTRSVDSLIVRWPSGHVDRVPDPPIEEWLLMVEGEGLIDRLDTPVLETPLVDEQIAFEAPNVDFTWSAAGHSVSSDVTYTLLVRGPALDTTITGLTVPTASLPTSLMVQRGLYKWMAFARDEYTVRRSTDVRSFTFAGERGFPMSELAMDLPGVTMGGIRFGDLGSDYDLDIAVVGRGEAGPAAYLFEAIDTALVRGGAVIASKRFRQRRSNLVPMELGSVDWGDYDADGDVDLLTTGALLVNGAVEPATVVYANEGGFFSVDPAVDLPGTFLGEPSWIDFDGDRDLDILLTGASANATPLPSTTELFENNGGRFQQVDTALPPVHYSSAAWGDLDGDGDLDVALMGDEGRGVLSTKVYTNEGAARFVLADVLPGAAHGSMDWGDFDNDGDLDLLLMGSKHGPEFLRGYTRIFRNDSGAFAEVQPERDFAQLGIGECQWADFDNDGDLDIALVGAESPFRAPRLVAYRNENGRFALEFDQEGLSFSSMTVGDYNADGDLDIAIVGQRSDATPVMRIMLNQFFTDPISDF